MQEELPSEDKPYILKVEEPVVSWHEIEGTSIVDIAIQSFEEDVLKLLKGHYYSFLEKDEGKNPQLFRSWYSQVGLKNGVASKEATQAYCSFQVFGSPKFGSKAREMT